MEPNTELSPEPSARSADERMADLAVFADGLVHDLRNPLNVIRTNVYLLRQRLSVEDNRAIRAVDRIDDQVSAAMRLLDGVQAFYRADRPNLQRLNVNEALRSATEGLPVPDGVELNVDAAEELPLVSADPQLLEAALRALIRNAVEATAAAGAIRLASRAVDNGVQLVVEDSGPGFGDVASEDAFEPFFTSRRAQAGLGLALVEKVARAHGGRSWIESGPPTRIIIEIPSSE